MPPCILIHDLRVTCNGVHARQGPLCRIAQTGQSAACSLIEANSKVRMPNAEASDSRLTGSSAVVNFANIGWSNDIGSDWLIICEERHACHLLILERPSFKS